MSFLGRKNVYTCDTCGGFTVTLDVDEGVTPFMINCRASDDCPGDAMSAMYPHEPWPPHIPTEPTWEWYRPSEEELFRLDRAEREHIRLGGLRLRKREASAAAVPA